MKYFLFTFVQKLPYKNNLHNSTHTFTFINFMNFMKEFFSFYISD